MYISHVICRFICNCYVKYVIVCHCILFVKALRDFGGKRFISPVFVINIYYVSSGIEDWLCAHSSSHLSDLLVSQLMEHSDKKKVVSIEVDLFMIRHDILSSYVSLPIVSVSSSSSCVTWIPQGSILVQRNLNLLVISWIPRDVHQRC